MAVTAAPTPVLPGLLSVFGRAIVARFDIPYVSSDGGGLTLREVELWLGIAHRLAACMSDRTGGGLVRGIDGVILTLMVAADYEDGNEGRHRRYCAPIRCSRPPVGPFVKSLPKLTLLERALGRTNSGERANRL